MQENASARSLEQSQIGNGGTLKVDGSLLVTGSLTVPGTLASAGALTAGTTIAAGGAITGASIAVTGAATSASLAVSGNATAAAFFGTDLYSANAAGYNITGTRSGGWWETATGRAGTAVSSRRFKTGIVDSGIDPLAVLAIGVKHYQYLAEIAKRDDPNSPDYVGPTHQVHLEVGAIAEDLHAAGLWEFVQYERDESGVAKLDESGDVVPRGIHYEMFSLAVLVASQHVWTEHLKVRSDTDRILAHLGI
jgi:hypothetical protein